MKPFIPYRYSRFVVAAILFFSALTKAHLTATEPSDEIEWFAMGTVLFESALALALALGLFPRWIKYTAIAVFAVFFCVAVDLAMKAASSCGCFGHVHVDPKITACLDIAVVLLLLFSRHDDLSLKPSRPQIAIFCAGMALFLLLLIPMSMHPPISKMEHPIDHVSGDFDTQNGPPFKLLPEQVDLGYVESKSVHRFTLELVNNTNEDRQIDRIETECECIAVVESPRTVPQRSRMPVTLEFTAPNLSGPYSKTISVTSKGEHFETRMSARIDHPLIVKAVSPNEAEDSFTIFNESSAPIRLLYATVTPPVGTVKIDGRPIEPGQTKTLKIEYREAKPPEKITVRIHTNHRSQKQVEITP